jgi:drug/metabolite transporter (DMT)-like permease
VTVLLAYFINREPFTRLQRIGLVTTIVATALIAL